MMTDRASWRRDNRRASSSGDLSDMLLLVIAIEVKFDLSRRSTLLSLSLLEQVLCTGLGLWNIALYDIGNQNPKSIYRKVIRCRTSEISRQQYRVSVCLCQCSLSQTRPHTWMIDGITRQQRDWYEGTKREVLSVTDSYAQPGTAE